MTRRTVIVERLGEENAAKLSRIAGGRRFHVPGLLRNADRIIAQLGYDLAVLVILHFGDSRIYVPVSTEPARTRTGRFTFSIDRRKAQALLEKGMSASAVAAKLNCSDRSIYALRANPLSALPHRKRTPRKER